MSDKNDVVIINLDRPRTLWFGHKAIKTLGALTGKDFDATMETNSLDTEELEKTMYCLLLRDAKENNETLKLEDMEDLLDQGIFGEIIAKMQEAINVGMGTFAGDDNGKNLERIALEAQQRNGNGAGKNR